MKNNILFFLLLNGLQYAYSQTQTEMNLRAREEFYESKTVLDQSFQKIFKEKSKNSLNLFCSQLVWLVWLDQYLNQVLPPHLGSLYPLEYFVLKKGLYERRIDDLQSKDFWLFLQNFN